MKHVHYSKFEYQFVVYNFPVKCSFYLRVFSSFGPSPTSSKPTWRPGSFYFYVFVGDRRHFFSF